MDGSLPLRAVQHCPPVVEGSAAGFQIVLAEPLTLRRRRSGLTVTLTRGGFERTRQSVDPALDRLADRGLLRRGGIWERLFRADALALRDHRLLLWTGWLVRPALGLCLLVSGAYNRRSPLAVREHVVTDAGHYTPLVLDIDLAAVTAQETWVEEEIGCVTPLRPAIRFSVQPVQSAPDVGLAAVRFYDTSYFAEKRVRATGRYRKLHGGLSSDGPEQADCRLTYGGPRSLRVSGRWPRAGPDGWSRWGRTADASLEQVIVRSACKLQARWDGRSFTDLTADMPASRQRLARVWRRLYGPGAEDALEFFSRYLIGTAPDEHYFAVQPWVFVQTPPGWSSLVDGFHGPIYDGMRAVIATDAFTTSSMLYRLFRPGLVRIARGAPLLRVLPVPRSVLQRPLRQVAVDDADPLVTVERGRI